MTTEPITPTDDPIAKSKRILEFVDLYHEHPDRQTRQALRSALLHEFEGGIGVAASQPADPDDMLGSTCLFVAHPDGSYSPAPAETIHAVSAQLAGNEPWPDDAPLNDDHELFVAWRSSQEAGFMEGGDEDRDWRVWQGARSLPPVAAPLGAAEPPKTLDAITEAHEALRSMEAERLWNKGVVGDIVAERLRRAFARLAASTAPVVQPMPSQGASALPTTLSVASLPEPEVSSLRVPIAGADAKGAIDEPKSLRVSLSQDQMQTITKPILTVLMELQDAYTIDEVLMAALYIVGAAIAQRGAILRLEAPLREALPPLCKGYQDSNRTKQS